MMRRVPAEINAELFSMRKKTRERRHPATRFRLASAARGNLFFASSYESVRRSRAVAARRRAQSRSSPAPRDSRKTSRGARENRRRAVRGIFSRRVEKRRRRFRRRERSRARNKRLRKRVRAARRRGNALGRRAGTHRAGTRVLVRFGRIFRSPGGEPVGRATHAPRPRARLRGQTGGRAARRRGNAPASRAADGRSFPIRAKPRAAASPRFARRRKRNPRRRRFSPRCSSEARNSAESRTGTPCAGTFSPEKFSGRAPANFSRSSTEARKSAVASAGTRREKTFPRKRKSTSFCRRKFSARTRSRRKKIFSSSNPAAKFFPPERCIFAASRRKAKRSPRSSPRSFDKRWKFPSAARFSRGFSPKTRSVSLKRRRRRRDDALRERVPARKNQ